LESYNKYIARTFHGLEGILEKELEALGAKDCQKIKRAVAFHADLESLYRINFRSRISLAVVRPLFEDVVKNENQLYRVVNDYPWEDIFKTDRTFAIQSIVHSKTFSHSQYAALKTKDAIVDRFRKQFGRRPDVDREDPDISIVLHIHEHKLTISLDSSGEGLFKRGYRQRTGPAPLNEVLAAGIVRLSKWDGSSDLIDPMCGSGTIPIEAAGIQSGKPAQNTSRSFGFENWPDFDNTIWFRIKREKSSPLGEGNIYASDRDNQILGTAMENARAAKFQDKIQFSSVDFFDLKPPSSGCTLIMNPPYDIRLKEDEINDFYKMIGDQLKQYWTGSTAWIFTANLEAAKHIGLRSSKKIELFNGPHEGRLLKFEVY
jgi:putative N6-adenine-specific DNA methylase